MLNKIYKTMIGGTLYIIPIKRIADTVIATFIMFGVAVFSPLLLAAYKEAKREEDWFRDILDKPE